MENKQLELSRARYARAAIERLYIEMRHLFNSGSYQNLGTRGEVLTDALLTLSPEIYGSMNDPNKVELAGLTYVIDRLPRGIEECRFIKLVSEEGYSDSDFEVIIPASRRRNCYRIDENHIFIEVTRGRSEIYDILTHLTFLYIEAEKIKNHVLDEFGELRMEWRKLESIVNGSMQLNEKNIETAFAYVSSILGRTFEETRTAYNLLAERPDKNNGLFHVVYWLGKIALNREMEDEEREISFSPTLRERIGHHIYGEAWAKQISDFLIENELSTRPLHIISANMHSVMNCFYAYPALRRSMGKKMKIQNLALLLSQAQNGELRKRVNEYADQHGMHTLTDQFGTNISVQIIDTAQIDSSSLSPELNLNLSSTLESAPVLLIMDYAFGEQAFETMDELLKPIKNGEEELLMPVKSISVMGKAGILYGGKGDIMVPNAHVFEGTADNYPFVNDLTKEDFNDFAGKVCEGPMITVLGTSLQNRDVLAYFRNSSWGAIGLEMEGAHYQKAIQAAAYVRQNIQAGVILRYAYYASDNPLESGSTLASGSLGEVGVAPTYFITKKILERIFIQHQHAHEEGPSSKLQENGHRVVKPRSK